MARRGEPGALMAPSHSRNVNGYVTAERRRRRLAAQLEAKERALDPLRVKARDADTAAKIRYRKLTGGQLAEARRIVEVESGRPPRPPVPPGVRSRA